MSSVFSLLRGKATMCESILKICIFTFFSDIAYETLLCRGFKQKKKTRNATRCNNRNDLLHLSFTLKISIFKRPIYNPVEYLYETFIAKIVSR